MVAVGVTAVSVVVLTVVNINIVVKLVGKFIGRVTSVMKLVTKLLVTHTLFNVITRELTPILNASAAMTRILTFVLV